ncbi:GNAT family N-acetyltransferase [Actinomycetospora soli]|uniref:GNAT family N-acetyltransferase n=1 Tax=Actinomycetospora soli TaxID=2893887 RepID=UPI001E30A2DA|nr:GNAT family protein [Actinomycetospora soli]MCD2188675.1 GNAT family N-acetyltransferase [Actinomycetospora soli]
MTVLLGALTRLRPWRDDDAEAIFRACQDADVQRFTTVPSPYRREDADWFLAHHIDDVEAEGGASFCVEGLAEPGRVAGSMALLHIREGVGEVGYWCTPEVRGRGWTADALATVAAWAFAERGCRRLELTIEPANVASLGVARRAGFVEDHVDPARRLRDGSVREVVVLALER